LTPEIINVLVTLKENRAMVDWSIGGDVEEKVVEVESKVEKSSVTIGSFVTEKYHILII
jgi:hypothetical protein